MTPIASIRGPEERPVALAVSDGTIIGTHWRPEAPGTPVLALHGVTANHRSFRTLAEALTSPLLAIDQRGRGASRGLPSPYTIEALADDAAAALASARIGRAVVVGHSMGAFVAVALAARHPRRVAGLVLVDGGLPLPCVHDPAEILGPAVERLSMTFDSPEAYRDFWKNHPAFHDWTPLVQEYADYDLVPSEAGLHPATRPQAVADAMPGVTDPALADALAAVEVPAVLLRSPRGLFDETPGLYDDQAIEHWRARLPRLDIRDVPDTNHYTILLGNGVDQVSRAVDDVLRG